MTYTQLYHLLRSSGKFTTTECVKVIIAIGSIKAMYEVADDIIKQG